MLIAESSTVVERLIAQILRFEYFVPHCFRSSTGGLALEGAEAIIDALLGFLRAFQVFGSRIEDLGMQLLIALVEAGELSLGLLQRDVIGTKSIFKSGCLSLRCGLLRLEGPSGRRSPGCRPELRRRGGQACSGTRLQRCSDRFAP